MLLAERRLLRPRTGALRCRRRDADGSTRDACAPPTSAKKPDDDEGTIGAGDIFHWRRGRFHYTRCEVDAVYEIEICLGLIGFQLALLRSSPAGKTPARLHPRRRENSRSRPARRPAVFEGMESVARRTRPADRRRARLPDGGTTR